MVIVQATKCYKMIMNYETHLSFAFLKISLFCLTEFEICIFMSSAFFTSLLFRKRWTHLSMLCQNKIRINRSLPFKKGPFCSVVSWNAFRYCCWERSPSSIPNTFNACTSISKRVNNFNNPKMSEKIGRKRTALLGRLFQQSTLVYTKIEHSSW